MFDFTSATTIIYLLIALIVSVVLHEVMHGQVAYWLGDRTAADAGRLTLNPLASVDPIGTILVPLVAILVFHVPFFAAKPVPFNPNQVKWDEYGAALVGLAGPATNFILALVGALLFRLDGGAGAFGQFAYIFTLVNVGMMIFNLIPFPPLDGSRVLYAFAPEPLRDLMERIESLGFFAILLIFFIAVQFLSPVIVSLQQTILQFLLGGSV